MSLEKEKCLIQKADKCYDIYNIKAIIDLRFDGRHPCLDTALDEAGMTHLQELNLEIEFTSQKH